jgi:hypothetical protein
MLKLPGLEEPNNPDAITFLRHRDEQHILGFKDSTSAAEWLEQVRYSASTHKQVKAFLRELFDRLHLLPLRISRTGRVSIPTKHRK